MFGWIYSITLYDRSRIQYETTSNLSFCIYRNEAERIQFCLYLKMLRTAYTIRIHYTYVYTLCAAYWVQWCVQCSWFEFNRKIKIENRNWKLHLRRIESYNLWFDSVGDGLTDVFKSKQMAKDKTSFFPLFFFFVFSPTPNRFHFTIEFYLRLACKSHFKSSTFSYIINDADWRTIF